MTNKRDPRSEVKTRADLDRLIDKHWENPGLLHGDLWIVSKKNPYFPLGTYVYSFDQGFQKVRLRRVPPPQGSPSRGPLWRLETEDSIFVPHSALLPFVRKIPRRQF